MVEEKIWGSKVLYRFYGNKDFPIEWKNDEEKKIHFVLSDQHNPHPTSPLYVDICCWFDSDTIPDALRSCEYMYRRFWAPIGKSWAGKVVNGYIYHGPIPPDPETLEASAKYYGTVMPIYAEKFLEWWEDRLLPEIERNLKFLDNYPYQEASLHELLVLFEDAIDIFARHFRIHWILNLAQFQAFLTFKGVFTEVFGEPDENLTNRILISVEDKNWESIEGLWKLKEFVKSSTTLKNLFEEIKAPEEIPAECEKTKDGKEFLKRLREYLDEFGWKSIYAHELQFPSWRENPSSAIETIRTYLTMDYAYPDDIKRCKEDQKSALDEMWKRAEEKNVSEEEKRKLKSAADKAIKMAPLTPNHHFYIDQGSHQRMRRMAIEIGKKMVDEDILEDPGDIVFLHYNEIREIGTNPKAFNAKELTKKRKKEIKEAEDIIPSQMIGTVTEWSLHEEPYKQGLWGWSDEKLERAKRMIEEGVIGKKKIIEKMIKGIPASPGIAEGIARIVKSTEEFDRVEDGSIMFCDMTSPAWISVFPKLKAVVTNAGGVLAHPAIVSREFGIPCIVGTIVGTRQIEDGQKVRVNGDTGIIEILD